MIGCSVHLFTKPQLVLLSRRDDTIGTNVFEVAIQIVPKSLLVVFIGGAAVMPAAHASRVTFLKIINL